MSEYNSLIRWLCVCFGVAASSVPLPFNSLLCEFNFIQYIYDSLRSYSNHNIHKIKLNLFNCHFTLVKRCFTFRMILLLLLLLVFVVYNLASPRFYLKTFDNIQDLRITRNYVYFIGLGSEKKSPHSTKTSDSRRFHLQYVSLSPALHCFFIQTALCVKYIQYLSNDIRLFSLFLSAARQERSRKNVAVNKRNNIRV